MNQILKIAVIASFALSPIQAARESSLEKNVVARENVEESIQDGIYHILSAYGYLAAPEQVPVITTPTAGNGSRWRIRTIGGISTIQCDYGKHFFLDSQVVLQPRQHGNPCQEWKFLPGHGFGLNRIENNGRPGHGLNAADTTGSDVYLNSLPTYSPGSY